MAALALPAPPDITRMIQNEYQVFFRRYEDHATGLRVDSLTSRTRFDPNEANFACTRDGFYVSLLHENTVDTLDSRKRFDKCADQGIPVAPGAAVDPVDSAIHAYSTLISNLIKDERIADARFVIEFLQDNGVGQYYNRRKNNVLALLGGDVNALRACPQGIIEEVLRYLLDVFTTEQRYIDSSPTVKKAIATVVIGGQPDMANVYREGMTPEVTNHFFAFILNQTRQYIDSLPAGMKTTIIRRLNDNASNLSVFLRTPDCIYAYPRAPLQAAALVADAQAAAQAAAQDAAAAGAAALAAAAVPFFRRTAADAKLYAAPPAAGGGKKRTLRTLRTLRKIKSKSKKSKSYKKKINRKKSHRRYR